MARAVDVFRENAIAKRKTEDELRASKEKAESALLELNTAQQNLIDAERLAALGGLVAGVAHEVNNPIGISLTVASSFARRAEMFESELRTEPLRRSKLDEFVKTSRDAAGQLVANLHRAGELIQSFKQVAVDRSHAERRQFNLSEATDQIVASLKPVLKKAAITLSVDVPDGLVIDGYPGSYGQILTNLFLNAANHAFADGRSGAITISARARGSDDVEIIFADNGAGMTPDVQRQAFDPFFTTRRNEGGTGLGLHIVYNLVTQQLGGRMMLEVKAGTRHHIPHYHAEGRQGRIDRRTYDSRPDSSRRNFCNGRTGRCPPPDRRYRDRSGGLVRPQMEDRRHRRRCRRARRHPLCAERLQSPRRDAGDPVGLFRGRRPHLDAQQSRRRGRAARRHHGNRRRGPGPRRVHPQRAQERNRPHHPAHRPAGPGARAPRHRPVRHQRLQGQDRADGRQAVHLADGGAAQLPAARAHGADPARA